MIGWRSARFLLLALGFATSAFLVLVGIAVFLLWENEDTLTQETYDQSGIAAVQLRVHYEKLLGALALAEAKPSSDNGENAALEFDILYERVKSLPTRPGYEYLLDADLLGHQRTILETLKNELKGIGAAADGDLSTLPGILSRLQKIRGSIIRLAHRPVQIASELRSEARQKLSQVARWLTVVITAFIVSGVVFVVVIWRQMKSAIERQNIIEESKNDLHLAKKQLEVVAYIDGLTGLPNRTQCQKDLSARIDGRRTDRPFAFIQIDLDNFKRVNDTLGHAAGDELLRVLGARLRLFSDHWDGFTVYRWGGDEFVAILDRRDDADVDAICEELNDVIAIPMEYGQTTLRPTISLGVARYPDDTTDIEALLVFADLALYKAKELGRDGYQFFTTEMKHKIDAESQIEQELRIAIEEDQLELYYQPQISTRDESVTGLEALLRWRHPERGVVAPGYFLGIVENTDMAPVVGRRVIDLAMQAARRWADAGIGFGRLSVNLSPRHLHQGHLVDEFLQAMKTHGVTADVLGVEILESVLLDDPNSNISDTLAALRDHGVAVELDDFGTGYASLSHLSTMPINGIKVDQSFVRRMHEDPKHMGIVSSLISMSKLLGLQVVCEGVETRDHVESIVRVADCSVQGYFISRPMTFEATTAWIANKRNVGKLRDLAQTPAKSA